MARLVDLTDDAVPLRLLLDDTRAWRQRLTETVTLDSPRYASVRSSWQVDLPERVLRPVAGDATERVRVILPLTTRPKGPLVGLDLSGPEGVPRPTLLPRKSIAALQAGYLRELVESSPGGPAVTRGLPEPLLEAACLFTPSLHRLYTAGAATERDALLRLLSEGVGWTPSPYDVDRWLDALAEPAELLGRRLLLPPSTDISSTECPLVALPHLEPRVRGRRDVDGLVERYVVAVRSAVAAGDGTLLGALAEYGRRFELMVEAELPVGTPSVITLAERRRLALDRDGWVRQRCALGDAASYHLQVVIADPAVEITDDVARDLRGRELPPFEDRWRDREVLTIYDSRADRAYYMEVGVRLEVARAVRRGPVLVGGLTVIALLLALVLPARVDVLGPVVLPTTFVVALLLVRERTSLAVELSARLTRWTAWLFAALWVVVTIRLLVVAYDQSSLGDAVRRILP